MLLATVKRVEVPVAIGLMLIGVAMTTWAAFSHSAPVVAPGATLIFLGGAWTGSALARQGVRLFRAAGGDDRNPGDTGD
jgi:hypothetical protein